LPTYLHAYLDLEEPLPYQPLNLAGEGLIPEAFGVHGCPHGLTMYHAMLGSRLAS
jgi:hypothetical protein